jgi:hypothetical protein
MDEKLIDKHATHIFNVVTNGGCSGYFLSGLINHFILRQTLEKLNINNYIFSGNEYNEYKKSVYYPLVDLWHYNRKNNDFFKIENDGIKLEDFLSFSKNIFIACYDEDTANFTHFCSVIKHSHLEYESLLEEHKFRSDGSAKEPASLKHYEMIKDLAGRMIKINPYNNDIFDYKKLVMEADDETIKRFCSMTNTDKYFAAIKNSIIEYHNRNLNLIEKHRQILVDKRNS